MPSVQHRINNKRPQTKAELAKQKDNRKSVSIENTDPNYILQFYSDCLRRHNELRRFHGCKKLKFSDELALQAQDWAEYLCDEDKYHSRLNG